ncbi:MAG: hypothetical protein GVY04_15610 [Cyanobacteria bacterium]|jgi:hypothetical protein|nr:hypothetical protein [Cyanobacteria bacterium GSL.Bin1]
MLKQQLRRKLKYTFKKNLEQPKRFFVFLLARFQFIRVLYSRFLLRSADVEVSSISRSMFNDLNVKEIVETLQNDGIYAGIVLPNHILANILNYTNSYNCFAGGRTHLGFKISNKDQFKEIFDQPFYTARYFNVSIDCPSVLELANDPVIREIASNYIGLPAKYTGASLFWTFPTQVTTFDHEQQYFSHFHYDLDDFASVRFCFYLSHVTVKSGAHVCIRGSHRKKSLLHVLNYFSRTQSEQKLAEFYGLEQFITLIGEAGFGFIEDTFCFHRGTVPETEPRLFLQLHFAANRYSSVEYHEYRAPNLIRSFSS